MLSILNKILFYLLGHSYSPYFTGALLDERSTPEQEQDHLHEERVVSAPVNPFGNTILDVSPYFYENQNGTSSCVPHGVGLALAIERKTDTNQYQRLSWIFNYRLRSNYPAEGTSMPDAFNSYKNFGAPLYTTLSDPMYESDANAVVPTTQMFNEAAIFKGLQYWTIGTPNNIDTLAGVAAQGHGVPILIYATYDEWARQYPQALNTNLVKETAEVRHCVSILPNSGFIKDGVKYVAVQDSAWFGGWKLRYLSEGFIKARVYGAGYWDTVAIVGTGPRPVYHFTQTLKFGATGPEVKAMQQLLVSEGLLPPDCTSGLFAGKTLAAVNAFQSRYAADILIPNGLTAPTGLWGQACVAKANSLV